MRQAGCVIMAMTIACVSPVGSASKVAEKPLDPIRLEVTLETAATTEDGYPSALRITLRNIGDGPVDMPMPGTCQGEDGALHLQFMWHSEDGHGSGGGCGGGLTDRSPLMDRARNEWLRLQPGEFLIMTKDLRPFFRNLEAGTAEYWIEYDPPALSSDERLQLQRTGYFVPTEKVETAHQSVTIR
jgi:hypothetical protein